MNEIIKLFQEHFFDTVAPFGLFTAALLFAIPDNVSMIGKAAYVLFGAFLFGISWKRTFDASRVLTGGAVKKIFQVMLLASVIFFIFSRLVMFVRYGEAPLGYDTGFYLNSIDAAFEDIEGTRTVRTLLWIPFKWFGVPNVYILHGLYVLAQFLMFGSTKE